MGFEPYERVLTRATEYDYWQIDFFSHYGSGDGPYVTLGFLNGCQYCISYEDNKHYLGTNKAEE